MFGIARLRAGQEDNIRSVLERCDTLATVLTGAGKSLCYELPALHLDGTTLVVSPLIALMKDQAKNCWRRTSSVRWSTARRSRDEREALQRIRREERHHFLVTLERPRIHEGIAGGCRT